MRKRRLTMAQALVLFLKQQFVARDDNQHRLIHGVCGIFGHGNVAGLGQALEEQGGAELPFYQPKNEQAMVHMAVAFAKTRRRLGTLACTTSVGPGATNMVTGAATATINRLPVLLLPGDVFANRRSAPVLQQLEHPSSMDVSVNDCFRPVSRYWDRIQRPEQILQALPEAMRVLASPAETGAVTICLPEDVQSEAYDYPENFFAKKTYVVARPQPAEGDLAAVAQVIAGSQSPVLVAGGGVHYSEAHEALRSLVEKTRIPVVTTQAGKGALPDTHELCLGALGTTGTAAANHVARNADVVLAVGTRFSDFTTASRTLFANPRVQFINMQINDFDAHKLGGMPLVCDARQGLLGLANALDRFVVDDAAQRETRKTRQEWLQEREEILRPAPTPNSGLCQVEVIRILNEHLNEKAVVVHAAGGLPGDLHKLWQCQSTDEYHSEYGYSCMGYEIAGALGVKLAAPRREVYALLGDGSYLMLHSEIVTSLQEGLKIIVVLLDNGGYQCIHGLQKACGGQSFGNEFRARDTAHELAGHALGVDYVQNARSLGAVAIRADHETALLQALQTARDETRTTLIHVPVHAGANVPAFAWWDVPMSEVSTRKATIAARKEYETKRKAQKFYY